MPEAPSFEVASLVPATPPIGKAPGVGYLEGKGLVSGGILLHCVRFRLI